MLLQQHRSAHFHTPINRGLKKTYMQHCPQHTIYSTSVLARNIIFISKTNRMELLGLGVYSKGSREDISTLLLKRILYHSRAML